MKLPLIALSVFSVAVLTGCSNSVTSPTTSNASTPESSAAAVTTASDYLGDYQITDNAFGTQTSVTVAGGTRTISTNALPNHETGEFPNSGNPNTITAQSKVWTFPSELTYVGEPQSVRETGVGINGVKFEPGTAEVAVCSSGESYAIEGLQDVTDLGMDFNNAHVQPNGEYHYHGVSSLLVDIFSSGEDLVHVGFAQDGGLIYYSKSGAYSSSYTLGTSERTGTDCTYTAGRKATIEFGATKDGSLTSDWEYSEANGDLDQCNGTIINGQYSYLITNEFPYIPRCLMGEFSESSRP